jgi:DNA-binding NtrC family response regulator
VVGQRARRPGEGDGVARILLLDLERDSLAMMKRFLELSGHEVKGLSEQGQLQESMANAPFDLAVINIAADCSNVNNLLRLLDDMLGDLKTIIITDSNADECMQDRPGHEFIFRPVDLEVLEARVKRMLEQGSHNHG